VTAPTWRRYVPRHQERDRTGWPVIKAEPVVTDDQGWVSLAPDYIGRHRAPVGPAQVGGLHIGRAWSGTALEADCRCGKAPCGLVDSDRVRCDEHAGSRTMRQIHRAQTCPAVMS